MKIGLSSLGKDYIKATLLLWSLLSGCYTGACHPFCEAAHHQKVQRKTHHRVFVGEAAMEVKDKLKDSSSEKSKAWVIIQS